MARATAIAPDGAGEAEAVDEFADGLGEAFEDDLRTDDDGYGLPDEVQAELEALAAADLDGGGEMEQALAQTQRELAQQRALTRQAVERYREALLAAEPELLPDLVRGETLEEVDAAVEAARRTVARIRERMEAERGKGFPVGAPARGAGLATSGLTPVEKITRGLQQRMLA